MKLRMRAALLALLGTAAVYTGLGAVKSLHPRTAATRKELFYVKENNREI